LNRSCLDLYLGQGHTISYSLAKGLSR
jgi:hypothetical protein